MNHLIAFCAAFVMTGLKAFQQKNVVGHHYKAIVVTSYMMTVADIINVMIIVGHGWEVAFAMGTGGALGMVVMVKLHSKIMGKKDEVHRDGS